MTTRFTRVTVVGTGSQIDVSLPADSPLHGQMPAVLRLLSVPTAPTPVRWRLSATEFGPLNPTRSLDECGVVDGSVLYLTEAAAAPPAPFVDDVERAIADVVAQQAPGWSGPARRDAMTVLVVLLLLAALLVGLLSPAPLGWAVPLGVLAAAGALGRSVRTPAGWAVAASVVPAAIALLYGVTATLASAVSSSPATPLEMARASAAWPGFPLAVGIAAGLGIVLLGLARRRSGLVAAGVTAATMTALALLAVRGGMPAERIAGLGLVAAVLTTGVAGQVALGGAGLVDLMRADEAGDAVPRTQVQAAVRRGLGLATGLVWAAAVTGAVSVWVLLLGVPGAAGSPGAAEITPGWIAPALGGLGAGIFALRARMFSRAVHIGPMLLVPVVAVVAVAVLAPGWLQLTGTPAAAVTVIVIAGLAAALVSSASITLTEVTAARLGRFADRLETVAVLALLPGLVLLFRVIPTVQQWWG